MLLAVRDRFSVVWDYSDRFLLVGLCRESGEIQFLYERGSCDLLLAALGPDNIRTYPFLLWCGFVFFVVEDSDGGASSVPIVCDTGLNLARRADTWDSPYGKAGRMRGSGFCDCSISFLLSSTTPNCIRDDPV